MSRRTSSGSSSHHPATSICVRCKCSSNWARVTSAIPAGGLRPPRVETRSRSCWPGSCSLTAQIRLPHRSASGVPRLEAGISTLKHWAPTASRRSNGPAQSAWTMAEGPDGTSQPGYGPRGYTRKAQRSGTAPGCRRAFETRAGSLRPAGGARHRWPRSGARHGRPHGLAEFAAGGRRGPAPGDHGLRKGGHSGGSPLRLLRSQPRRHVPSQSIGGGQGAGEIRMGQVLDQERGIEGVAGPGRVEDGDRFGRH